MRKLLLFSLVLLVSLAFSVSGIQAQVAPSGPTSAGINAPDCNGHVATDWLTTPGTLVGTTGNDVLVGSDGNDVIKGLGGNDIICGSTTAACDLFTSLADVLLGGAGNDQLVDACGGENTLDGGAGDDHIIGSGTLLGGSGNDVIEIYESYPASSSVKAFRADGGSGDDRLFIPAYYLGKPTVVMLGGAGSDYISGNSFSSIDCGSGTDRVAAEGASPVRRCERTAAP